MCIRFGQFVNRSQTVSDVLGGINGHSSGTTAGRIKHDPPAATEVASYVWMDRDENDDRNVVEKRELFHCWSISRMRASALVG